MPVAANTYYSVLQLVHILLSLRVPILRPVTEMYNVALPSTVGSRYFASRSLSFAKKGLVQRAPPSDTTGTLIDGRVMAGKAILPANQSLEPTWHSPELHVRQM